MSDQARFKVGDKVKIIHDKSIPSWEGRVGTISQVYPDSWQRTYMVVTDGDAAEATFLGDYQLEVAETAEHE